MKGLQQTSRNVYKQKMLLIKFLKSVTFSHEEPLHNSPQQPMCIQQPNAHSKTKSYYAVQNIKIKAYDSNFLHHKAQFT